MNKYLVNVAIRDDDGPHVRYTHFCRIELPDSLYEAEAIERAKGIRAKFGKGFKVEMTIWSNVGRSVDF